MKRFSLSFVLVTILLGGCSVGEFIGAYFNTYYNAQKAFTEAEQEALHPPVAASLSKLERPFLAPFDVSSQSKTKFTTVIEKCSKLLQYHPDSELVDDALLMIGKSYYYQNEHQSAERKFNELLLAYPESDLRFEAKLLLANTHYRKGDKPTAAVTARELIEDAQRENEESIVARAANLVAHIETENMNFGLALEYYKTAADLGETAEERSSAFRAVAEMYILQEDFAGAREAYAQAEDVANDYVSAYLAEIGQARMLAKLNRHGESLTLLGALIKNTNYREFFAEIDLAIAEVYRSEEDYPSAEAQYRYVDTAYARTETAANSYYRLGRMYEEQLLNYDSARVAYDKGRNEFPQSPITVSLIQRSEYFRKYFQYRSEIAKYDSIHYLILHPPDTAKSTMVKETTRNDSTTALAVTDSIRQRLPSAVLPPLDTVVARLALGKSELAGLFYSGLGVVDSAKYWYNRLLADHPTSVYTPRALYTLAQLYRQDSTSSSGVVDSLQKEILLRFPASEFAMESRRALGLPEPQKQLDPAETSFRNAESLVQKGDLSTALRSFAAIAENDSLSPLAARAQYAVGWIYENLKPNRDSSITHYQRLVKRFPSSQYVSLVQPKLSEVEAEKQRKIQEAKRDSTAQLPPPLKQSTDTLRTNNAKTVVLPGKIGRVDSLSNEITRPVEKEEESRKLE